MKTVKRKQSDTDAILTGLARNENYRKDCNLTSDDFLATAVLKLMV
jgi:hypothetical protein